MRVLVTGAAGMIGYHLCKRLLADGHYVVGVDDFNDAYYDSALKRHRASLLMWGGHGLDPDPRMVVNDGDLASFSINGYGFDTIVHLAAHAQVRHSMDRASEYILNNVTKTQALIDGVVRDNRRRERTVDAHNAMNTTIDPNTFELVKRDQRPSESIRVIYASTSCVMAGNPLPWREDEPTGHQLNPYGFTKRTNECQFMTSKIPNTIGLRFFTAYGPWGRPDMALFTFVKNILEGRPVELYNNGEMRRDFTYVEDVVEGIVTVMTKAPTEGHHIYNVGYGRQVDLREFLGVIEDRLGKKADVVLRPRHPADTLETWSDTTKIRALGWTPRTSIEDGVTRFVNWYRAYFDT